MDDVGAGIKALRTHEKLSQRALAKAAGVSNGTISLIESGKLDPTIGQLKKILAGLNTSIAEFFDSNTTPALQYFFTEAELVEIGSGKISFKHISEPGTDRQLQILNETYEPGADTGQSMLSHEGEEGGIIISGELEVQVLGKRKILRAGDAYQFPSHLPHRFRNLSDTPCQLITACTPPSF